MLYHVVLFFNARTLDCAVLSTYWTLAEAQADHARRYLAADPTTAGNLGIVSSDVGSAIARPIDIGTAP